MLVRHGTPGAGHAKEPDRPVRRTCQRTSLTAPASLAGSTRPSLRFNHSFSDVSLSGTIVRGAPAGATGGDGDGADAARRRGAVRVLDHDGRGWTATRPGVLVRPETRQCRRPPTHKPNPPARALRAAAGARRLVIIRDIKRPVSTRRLRGVNRGGRAPNMRLFLGHVDEPTSPRRLRLDVEQSHRDRTAILGDIAGGSAQLDDLATHHAHVVASATGRPGAARRVDVDNEQGTRPALEHLWQPGPPLDRVRRRRAHGRHPGSRALYRSGSCGSTVWPTGSRTDHTTQPDPEPGYRLGCELLTLISAGYQRRRCALHTIAIGLEAAFQSRVVVPTVSLSGSTITSPRSSRR